MPEFGSIARGILDLARERNTHSELRPSELEKAAPIATGIDPINCYPGKPGHGCYDFALFVTLRGSRWGGRGWPTFEETLGYVVNHMQGECVGYTNHACIVTTIWEAWAWEKWRPNLLAITKNNHLECWLIGMDDLCIPIPLT